MDGHPHADQAVIAQAIRHRSVILGVILAMVRDADGAEDILQETMLAIIRSQERFDTNRPFLPWAKGVARHQVMRWWRERAKRPATATIEALAAIAEAATVDAPEVWEEERHRLRACLERLPHRSRELLEQRYLGSVPADDLARRAGLSRTSLGTTLQRIRDVLRACLDRNATAPEGG